MSNRGSAIVRPLIVYVQEKSLYPITNSMKNHRLILFIMLHLFSGVVTGQKEWVVSKDGSGDFTSIQAAFDQVPAGNDKPITIVVKKGEYRERVVLDTRKNNVRLVGEDPERTVLTYNNHAGLKLPNGDTINTWSSATFFIYADDFHAENMTFQNNAGFTAGQAVALFVYGTRASFRNCRLTGFQDVLFCSGYGSKQYYEDCYIEGTTDFIFGPATAVFNRCHIHSKKNSHVTAASTPREAPYGFVFLDCRLTADSAINKVSLGRPWQPYASVTYVRCELGGHIIPEGWNNWKNPDNEKTARYAEFKSSGPGASVSGRVLWAKQLEKPVAVKDVLGDWKVEN